MELERVVDAFVEGRTDFARFCREVEQQLAHHPEYVAPALERVGVLKKSGRISPALHALISRELDRSSKGDITPSFDKPEAPPSVEPQEPAEATTPEAPPVLTNKASRHMAGAEPPEREASPQAPPGPAATPPATGTVLAGRYQLEAMLDRGGMSVVYRARDLRRHGLDAEAARVGIKLVTPEHAGRDYRRVLEREASLLAEFSHPGIVRMLGFDQDGECAFMVMELLSGERLRSRLVRSHPEPLPPGEAMRIIRELARALAYLHDRKLVHRDVKPANIFITTAGEVRLVDFGLAMPAGDSGDLENVALKAWTPLYASPEMLGGSAADPRDDVYSLGCVAYEILTGRHPWGSLPGDQAAQRKLRARRPAGLSRPRWKVLRKAISFQAAARPANAGEFIEGVFPPARPRRVVPWVAAALLAGIISGPALRDLATGPWLERLEPFIPAVLRPPPPLPPTTAPATPSTTPPALQPALPPAQVQPSEPPPEEDDAAVSVTVDEPVAESPEAPEEAPAEDEAAPGPEPAAVAQGPPAAAAMAFTSSRLRVNEGDAVRLELSRPAGYSGMLSVLWRTVDGSARNGVDFVGNSSWQQAMTASDARSLILFIPIVDDSVPNPDRNFVVELRQLPGGPPVGTPDRLEITILDDD